MKMVYKNSIELIGNTPMLLVKNMDTGPCNLYLKLESFNLGGSIKDRPAKNMIVEAEKSKRIKKGGTIVEATAGNTGIALAIIAIKKGYKVIIVVPDKMTVEKIYHLRALGAKVIVARSDVENGHPEYYLSIAEKIARKHKAFYINQFDNKNNLDSHYKELGPEIYNQLDGNIDAFVAGVGTGGTISGVGKYLKKRNNKCELILADPKGSILKDLINKGILSNDVGSWIVEGIGEDFCPPLLNTKIIKKAYTISDNEAVKTCNNLLKKEGILAGSSSGTLIAAALKYCRSQKKKKNVVTLVCDAGEKYLKKIYSENWRIKQNLDFKPKKNDLTDIVSYRYESNTMPTINHKSSCLLAFKLMQENNLSYLLVVNDHERILGIINEHMLLKAVRLKSFDENVKSFITKVPKIQYDIKIDKVINKMLKENHLLVYKNKIFFGILNREDLLSYLKNNRFDAKK